MHDCGGLHGQHQSCVGGSFSLSYCGSHCHLHCSCALSLQTYKLTTMRGPKMYNIQSFFIYWPSSSNVVLVVLWRDGLGRTGASGGAPGAGGSVANASAIGAGDAIANDTGTIA